MRDLYYFCGMEHKNYEWTWLEAGWSRALTEALERAVTDGLFERVDAEYRVAEVFPPRSQVMSALHSTPLSEVKVVILGQDPYHGCGEANGLAFSVGPGVAIPPSLRNILREVEAQTGEVNIVDGDLHPWASQGVLLLNTVLTVRRDQAKSHAGLGWQPFTDAVIEAVSREQNHVVFMLWGRDAAQKRPLIDESKHLVLTSAHPSPLSSYRGFFGNEHFTKANEFLRTHGEREIKW